jgi:cysteine desulfurase / selenocysteine lyase
MQYKNNFPIFNKLKNLVYLDSAATSQKPKEVIDSVKEFYTRYNSNIHRGLYTLSQKAEKLFEGTRKKVADFINASDESEIIFTGNATEAINLVAFGYFKKYLQKGDIVVLSEMEHHSNIIPWLRLKDELGINIFYLPITNAYKLNYKFLLNSNIDLKKVKLIALTHASNVLGTINPLEKIVPLLKKRCVNAKVLIDATQSIPHIYVNVKKLYCDFLAFSSHKMYGPSGVGVLFGKKEILEKMDPIFFGGSMILTVTKEKATFVSPPGKFEAGTGRLEAVVGLGAAIDYLSSTDLKNIYQYENTLTKYFLDKFKKIKDIKIYGSNIATNRLPVFSFNMEKIHPHDVAEILNRKQICVRSGHHCAQPLMEALKIPGTVRASFAIYNTTQDIDMLTEGLENIRKIFKI